MTSLSDFKDHSMDYLLDMKDEQSFELHRRRRNRTVFTPNSIALMEEQFRRNRYPDIHRREWLAEQIGVSEARVQVWFQNRRARSNKLKTGPDMTRPVVNQDTEETRSHKHEQPSKRRKVSKDSKPTSVGLDSDVAPPTKLNVARENRYVFNPSQMFLQYTAPYFLNYMIDFPITGHYQDFRFKQSPPSWYQESLKAYCGATNIYKKDAEDNIVDNLFRFSSPGYQHKRTDDSIQMIFPRILKSKYSMTNFNIAGDIGTDASIVRAPRMSDARDALSSEVYSFEGNESSSSSTVGSMDGSDTSSDTYHDDDH